MVHSTSVRRAWIRTVHLDSQRPTARVDTVRQKKPNAPKWIVAFILFMESILTTLTIFGHTVATFEALYSPMCVDPIVAMFFSSLASCELNFLTTVQLEVGIPPSWSARLILVTFGFDVSWIAFPILEALIDIAYAVKHSFEKPPEIWSRNAYWEVVAVVRSSNNGYGSDQLYLVDTLDTKNQDDRFSTDKFSYVFMVEFRRRNMIWNSVIVWQVSLLDGEKKKLIEFHHFTSCTDGHPFARRSPHKVSAFQNNGVVMIDLRQQNRKHTLFIYDLRYRKSATFETRIASIIDWRKTTASMSCQRRLFNNDGSVAGWQIQWLEISTPRCYCLEDVMHRLCLGKSTLELRIEATEARLINEESIMFGPCSWPRRLQKSWRLVRTSSGFYGIRLNFTPTDADQIIVHDHKSDRFVCYPDFDALLQWDGPSATYFNTPLGKRGRDFSPQVLTSCECIVSASGQTNVPWIKGVIYRTQFATSSLKFLAAKALFRARPNLRLEMSAKEFQARTGIEGMEPHFDW